MFTRIFVDGARSLAAHAERLSVNATTADEALDACRDLRPIREGWVESYVASALCTPQLARLIFELMPLDLSVLIIYMK